MAAEIPTFSDLVRALEAGGAPPGPPWPTPAEVIERFPELGAVQTTEIEVPAPSAPATTLPARFYAPVRQTGADGLVWVHGGGFMHGHYDMPESHWVALWLAYHGTPVLTLNYRKALHGIHFPTLHEDVVAGWRWALAHLDLFGSRRLHLGGASAGAALAVSTAQMAIDGAVAMPTSLLLAYPAVHPSLPAASPELTADLVGQEKTRFPVDLHREIALNYTGSEALLSDPIAFGGLRPEGLPPTIIRAAQYDDLRASAERFAADLRANSINVDYAYEPGAAHGYLNEPEDDTARTATLATLASFDGWLKKFAQCVSRLT